MDITNCDLRKKLHTYIWVSQSNSTLHDGKYKPNPRVMFTVIIANVGNATM